VNEDTVVGLFEALSIRSAIKAETRGIITEVLVEDGVEIKFGQPLFKIREVTEPSYSVDDFAGWRTPPQRAP
jgi:hypothetical protein